MLTHRGFEAWIECNGEQLTSRSSWCDSRTIGATVASVAGKPFGIHWRDCEGGIESFGIVQIDGNVIGGRGLNGVPGRAVAKTTLPMEVQMVTFRDYSAPLADARHSRSNSTSSIMTEADELAQTPVLNVYTPWTRL